MPSQFDPYRKWLGIPAKHQPAHHYRLLGIPLYERDADVIESAADRQMAHLRTFQSGKNSHHSQKLLNEIATAKACLLDPSRKEKYDAALQKSENDLSDELSDSNSAGSPPSQPPIIPVGKVVHGGSMVEEPPIAGQADLANPISSISTSRKAHSLPRRRKSSPWPIIIGVLGVVIIVILAVVVISQA